MKAVDAPEDAPEFTDSLAPTNSTSGIIDLELMHHWMTVTSTRIPVSPEAHRIFQEDIPRLGLRFPYLLHQFLALAAFHIAHIRQQATGEYMTRGSQHQNVAIAGMREALSEEMTEDNSVALAMTSSILMSSTFASHMNNGDRSEAPCPLTAILEIIPLQRGMRLVQKLATQRLASHPLQGFFDSNSETWKKYSFLAIKGQLEDLRAQLRESIYIHEDEKRMADSGVVTLLDSIDGHPGPKIVTRMELRVAFLWPSMMEEDFLDALRARRPSALTVFLYYCVMLRASEPNCWFLHGWAGRLAETISKLLCYAPWDALIQWPLGEIYRHSTEEEAQLT